eukprot:1591734-Prymnesium_polylepis.1
MAATVGLVGGWRRRASRRGRERGGACARTIRSTRASRLGQEQDPGGGDPAPPRLHTCSHAHGAVSMLRRKRAQCPCRPLFGNCEYNVLPRIGRVEILCAMK